MKKPLHIQIEKLVMATMIKQPPFSPYFRATHIAKVSGIDLEYVKLAMRRIRNAGFIELRPYWRDGKVHGSYYALTEKGEALRLSVLLKHEQRKAS